MCVYVCVSIRMLWVEIETLAKIALSNQRLFELASDNYRD